MDPGNWTTREAIGWPTKGETAGAPEEELPGGVQGPGRPGGFSKLFTAHRELLAPADLGARKAFRHAFGEAIPRSGCVPAEPASGSPGLGVLAPASNAGSAVLAVCGRGVRRRTPHKPRGWLTGLWQASGYTW